MAGILKANQINSMAGGLTPIAFNLHDVEELAKGQLEDVRIKAQQLIEQAKADAEKLRKESADTARREALMEMEAKFQQRSKELADKQTNEATMVLKNVISQLQAATDTWLQQWREQTLELALAIAGKIVRERVQREEEIVMRWLSESTAAWNGARRIEIRLSPHQYGSLLNRVEDILKPFRQNANCSIVEDPTVEAGGCLIKTDLGSMDWQISSQLESLAEQLR
jgi:flagellar assembly protein FliH